MQERCVTVPGPGGGRGTVNSDSHPTSNTQLGETIFCSFASCLHKGMTQVRHCHLSVSRHR